MIKRLISHEILMHIKSRVFLWAVTIFFVLFGIVFLVRVSDFASRERNYVKEREELNRQLEEAYNYSFVAIPVIKSPNLLSIYHEGHTHDFGTVIRAICLEPIFEAEKRSISVNKIYHFPNQIDVTFLITFFLSLLIFLVSFDAINGEKQNQTLRLLFTFPITRNKFFLKKLFGIVSLAVIVLAIPYFMSLFYLIFSYTEYMDVYFILYYFLYFLFACFYILIMALIGLVTSVITGNTERSLVFVLAIWMFLSIISPTVYQIFGKTISKTEKIQAITQQMSNLRTERENHMEQVPDDINPIKNRNLTYRGEFINRFYTLGYKETHRRHREYIKFYYENYFDSIQEEENMNIERIILNNYEEKLRVYVLFFNPNILFNKIAEVITQTSLTDYLKFLRSGIQIRNEWVKSGVENGWLFSNEYFALYDPDFYIPDFKEYIEVHIDRQELAEILGFPGGRATEKQLNERIQEMYVDSKYDKQLLVLSGKFIRFTMHYQEDAPEYDFRTPTIPHYTPRTLAIQEMLSRIYFSLIVMIIISGITFIINLLVLYRYDLR